MTIDLEILHLDKGGHESRDDGVCLMEAVAWWAGKDHTDTPPCVANVLGIYGRGLNDVLPDDTRQQLKSYVPLLPGTAGDGRDEIRGYMALDWLIRTYLPAWLDLAAIPGGSEIRNHPRIDSLGAAKSVASLVIAAGTAAGAAAGDAAGDAAWDAAWAAAWAATWAAAGAAVRAAAGAATWAAAGAAVRAAAGDAVRDAAGDAVRDAAGAAVRDAAGDAAWDAARAAARDAARAAAGAAVRDAAWDAAWAAAWAALAPTVAALQASAIQLYGQMIVGEWPA